MQFVGLKRRQFISLLGGAAAWPLATRAEQAAVPVIGFLNAISSDQDFIAAFRKGLAELRYVEGQNVAIEYRHADGHYDRLANLASELEALRVKLIVAVPSSPAALAAKKITSTIPIVFFTGVDPVGIGLVASFNRPGGNATGIAINTDELTGKRLELLHELLPKSVSFAFLVNPSNPNGVGLAKSIQQAARAIGRELIILGAATRPEIENAFAEMGRQHIGGLVVWQESYFTSERGLIVSLAERHTIPAIYGPRQFAESGGLMSYGPNRNELSRLIGVYAGKILQGTKAADLPVMQPTKFELVLNLKTAKALGLDVPATLLARADEVIE